MVTLRHPWGQAEPTGLSDGVDDGTFQLSLEEFHALCHRVSYEEQG